MYFIFFRSPRRSKDISLTQTPPDKKSGQKVEQRGLGEGNESIPMMIDLPKHLGLRTMLLRLSSFANAIIPRGGGFPLEFNEASRDS